MSIPRDVQEFLDGYPGAHDDPSQNANLKFYENTKRCIPDNLLIDEIHEKWNGDYSTLEWNHGFIQWLSLRIRASSQRKTNLVTRDVFRVDRFPIQEHGMNYRSQPLQRHELKAMKANTAIIARLLESYRLMLDFYGMRLVSAETGMLDRSLPPRNFASRYMNLCRSSHNNLRISRILKCLSEFGLENLNAGFLLHVLNEQSQHGELNTPSIRSSMDRWWANCLRNGEERKWISEVISRVRSSSGSYVFTREMYEAALERRKSTGDLREQEEVSKT